MSPSIPSSAAVPTATPRSAVKLSGNLGVGAIVFMVVAAAAPLTVIAGGSPVGMMLGNGAAYPATYLICAVVLMLFAVGFSAMSRDIDGGGAFYTYVAKGLGRAPGVGTAFLALATYSAVQLAVYGYLGPSLNNLFSTSVPWWVWALGAIGLVGLLGYRNIDLSGKVLGVLLIGEIGIVLIVSVAVVAQGGTSEGLSTAMFRPSAFFEGAPGVALMFAVAGFIGFESTAIFRDEARDPDRTIPRATYTALLVIGGFYAFASWALVSAWGDEGVAERLGGDPTTMFSETAKLYVGTAAESMVEVLLITSLFACVLSFHNVLARYLHALSHSAVLPQRMGATHDRHVSPHLSSLAQTVLAGLSVVACAAFGLDPVLAVFTWFSGFASAGVLTLMALTAVAVIAFYASHPGKVDAWHGYIAPGLGALGLLALLVITFANFGLLVGGATTAWILGLAVPGSFVLGFALAVARPHVAKDVLLDQG